MIIGLCIVGMCDILFKPNSNPNATTTLYANESIHEFYGVYKPKFVGNDTDHSGNEQLIGDVLIVCAQIIVASQMVYEEKVVSKYVYYGFDFHSKIQGLGLCWNFEFTRFKVPLERQIIRV